jgi:sugar phosphate isomerase/epimerase
VKSPLPIVAVQLYTLRNLMPRGMKYILQEVSAIGYRGIEIDSYGDLSFSEFKEAVDSLKIQVVGMHISFEKLEAEFDQIVAEQHALGNSILVSPSIPVELRTSAEGYKTFADKLAFWGEKLHKAGLKFCYHNHAFELEAQFDGRRGLDIIFQSTPSEYVQAEFDTYWIQRAGLNPARYISNYAGRTPVLHIKDMTDDSEQTYAEIGAGTLDWPQIFRVAEENGVQAYIVEQDECRSDPLECIRLSWENLQKMNRCE